MFSDAIISNAAPMVSGRILELINQTASEFRLRPEEVNARLKLVDTKVLIKAYHAGKVIKEIPFDIIAGNVGALIEGFVKKIFKKDVKKYDADLTQVSYMLTKDTQSDKIMVHPYIKKQYRESLELKQLLSNKY